MLKENKRNKPLLKLKGMRAERLMTQEEIADILGISTATYNRKENGNGSFTSNEISILLEVFKVRYEDVFLARS